MVTRQILSLNVFLWECIKYQSLVLNDYLSRSIWHFSCSQTPLQELSYVFVKHYSSTQFQHIFKISSYILPLQSSITRRLLQMGIYNCEIFNNLGLCCFYAQQYDMTLTCFERALSLATDESVADVWYNLGHIALVCMRCSCVPMYKISL